MAVKGTASITLSHEVDIIGTTHYYKLINNMTIPNVPADSVSDPTVEGWSIEEPSYTSGTTSYLYYTIRTRFSNGTQSYSYAYIDNGNRKACLSSSYEAAKAAANKADAVNTKVDNLPYIGENLLLYSKGDQKKGFFNNATIDNDDNLTFDFVLPASSGDNWSYKNIQLTDGFRLNIDEYEPGQKYTWSYEIRYLIYDNITSRSEWWMGQRYTNSYTTINWQAITQINLPNPTYINNQLDTEWKNVTQTITIPNASSYPQPVQYTYSLLTTKPVNWEEIYIGYFTKSGENYIPITDNVAPTWVANTFYEQIVNSPSNVASIQIGYKATNTAHVKIQLRNVKLEKGERATSWNISDEEIQNDIDESYKNSTSYADIAIGKYDMETAETKYYKVSNFNADMELRDGNLKTQWNVDISEQTKDGNSAYNYVIKKLRPYIKQSLDTSFILLTEEPEDWDNKYSTDYWMQDEFNDYITIPAQDTVPTFEINKYYKIDPNSSFKPLLTLSTGEENSCKLVITNDEIRMQKGDDSLTNWTVNDMNVNNVNANNSVRIGPFSFVYNSTDGLSLKKIN